MDKNKIKLSRNAKWRQPYKQYITSQNFLHGVLSYFVAYSARGKESCNNDVGEISSQLNFYLYLY